MYMTNWEHIQNIVNPDLETITFWWKKFIVRRLSIKAILKIAWVVSSVWTALNLWAFLDKWWDKKIDLSFLQYVDDNEINEIIWLVLKIDKSEVEELFNVEDFIKLIKIVIKQEDIKKIFLEVSQLTDTITEKAAA